MNPYQYSYSLRFRHPSIDPSEITKAVGIAPKGSWKAGDPRVTPKGTPLSGFRESSYWYAEMAETGSANQSLPESLRATLQSLVAHKPFFARIRGEGGSVALFVGWYVDRSGGDTFGSELLRQFADLGVDLELEVYSEPQSHSDD